jgi:C4-dicarboxylate-specific signal transduction histidine kinase
MVDHILLSIKRSQSIIENFSDLYKSNSKMEKIEMKNLIQEVFTLTKSESRSIKTSILIDGEEGRDEIFLIGNKTWLAQIFFNLIINSAQAMKLSLTPNPEITIKIQEDGEKSVANSFTDNGPGIKHPSERIFSPFFTTKKEGTGLGLNICKNLIEKMGGQIKLLKNDKGASFKLILPNENTHS